MAIRSGRWTIATLAACILFAGVTANANAMAQDEAAKTRLLNVWLDLQLVPVFYPSAKPAEFPRRIRAIAKQLRQPRPHIRQGRRPEELTKFALGTVLVKVDAPANVLILYSRTSDRRTFELIDDAQGRLRVFELRTSSHRLPAA